MNLRIGAAVAVATCAVTLSACGDNPPDPTINGTVSHAGRYANSGAHFMLQGSDTTYDCFINESDNCTLIKEGLEVSVTYTVLLNGSRSVTDLKVIDSPSVKPTMATNPNKSAPQ